MTVNVVDHYLQPPPPPSFTSPSPSPLSNPSKIGLLPQERPRRPVLCPPPSLRDAGSVSKDLGDGEGTETPRGGPGRGRPARFERRLHQTTFESVLGTSHHPRAPSAAPFGVARPSAVSTTAAPSSRPAASSPAASSTQELHARPCSHSATSTTAASFLPAPSLLCDDVDHERLSCWLIQPPNGLDDHDNWPAVSMTRNLRPLNPPPPLRQPRA
ncbi:hypothetical protein BDZ97DRAFT_1931150 [Flammula alnicola]|nr:hypothetical protein BDZ97DRAFT_1931150 [Flammula alnicola]